MEEIQLKRVLSLSLATYYGLGTILGAGIYALVGKVASHAGMLTPWAFLIASCIAFFTAASYAELGARFPRSAGGAYYVNQAFHLRWLSGLVGWLIVLTGIISAAAISHAFAGYLQSFLPSPSWAAIIFLFITLGAIVIWGIKESAIAAMLITLIEIAGLLLVIFVSRDGFLNLTAMKAALMPSLQTKDWSGILSGAFIAFYAFIGFEDMANLAEEIKSPEKNLPRAIFISLIAAVILYVLVTLAIVLSVPIEALGQQTAPMAWLMTTKGYSPLWISAISLIAVVNGALVQMIMGSRLIYGMAKQKNAPALFAKIYKKTQTPLISTLFVTALMIFFALWLPIETLARVTNSIMLCVFILINASLIIVKKNTGKQPAVLSFPLFIPILGAFLSAVFLISSFIVMSQR